MKKKYFSLLAYILFLTVVSLTRYRLNPLILYCILLTLRTIMTASWNIPAMQAKICPT